MVKNKVQLQRGRKLWLEHQVPQKELGLITTVATPLYHKTVYICNLFVLFVSYFKSAAIEISFRFCFLATKSRIRWRTELSSEYRRRPTIPRKTPLPMLSQIYSQVNFYFNRLFYQNSYNDHQISLAAIGTL